MNIKKEEKTEKQIYQIKTKQDETENEKLRKENHN